MKAKTFTEIGTVILYLLLILAAIALNIAGFELLNQSYHTILASIYIFSLLFFIISFCISEHKNYRVVINILLLALLIFSNIPYKVITLLIIFPCFFFKDIHKTLKIIGISSYSILITIGLLSILFRLIFGDFGYSTVVERMYSPNQTYRTVTIRSDQGALGGETYVNLEKIYWGMLTKEVETIYEGKYSGTTYLH